MISFPSHLKKLCSILRFWLKKLNCGFFTCFTREKTPQNNFPSQNFSVKITIPPITCYYLFNFLYYIYVYLNSVSVTSPNGKLLGNIPILVHYSGQTRTELTIHGGFITRTYPPSPTYFSVRSLLRPGWYLYQGQQPVSLSILPKHTSTIYKLYRDRH